MIHEQEVRQDKKGSTAGREKGFPKEVQEILARSRKVRLADGGAPPEATAASRGGYGEVLTDENGNPVIHTTDGMGHHMFAYPDGVIIYVNTNIS